MCVFLQNTSGKGETLKSRTSPCQQTDRLKIAPDRNGHYFVTDDSGFHRQVRNEVEGKFFLYAQQRGQTELRLAEGNVQSISAPSPTMRNTAAKSAKNSSATWKPAPATAPWPNTWPPRQCKSTACQIADHGSVVQVFAAI
jgi:hypothetical protein